MADFQIFIFLMAAAILLVGFSQRLKIPYPLALVFGGAALSFVPHLEMMFDPNLVLIIVIPPILFYSAFALSFREFRSQLHHVFSLAIGLVVVTTLLVGLLFKWLFPDIPWALAFAFGAIVSPPDAAAASSILSRFAISPRLSNILEGESLINDASALVLYRLAIVALLSGTFSWHEALFRFSIMGTGGLAVGLISGLFIYLFSRKFLTPVVGVMFSFVTPYIIFILADHLEVSGVLAVVTAGIIGSRMVLTHHSSLRRVLTVVPWDIFIILLNCFVFILIGMQMRVILQELTNQEIALYTLYGLLFAAMMIVIRMIWIYTPHLFAKREEVEVREDAILSWAGMRGIVSLTAALAIPITYANQSPIFGRDEVIFITFIVICVTLFVPGLTLAPLLNYLKIHHSRKHDVMKIRKRLIKVAQQEIHHLEKKHLLNRHDADFMLNYLRDRQTILEAVHNNHHVSLKDAKIKVLQAQRQALLKMWRNHELDDLALRQLESELDLEETQELRAEIK